MKFFLVLFLGAVTMVMITRCNSSSPDNINEGKKADSVAPVEGGSYNKDTTSYERGTDTGESHHADSASMHR